MKTEERKSHHKREKKGEAPEEKIAKKEAKLEV